MRGLHIITTFFKVRRIPGSLCLGAPLAEVARGGTEGMEDGLMTLGDLRQLEYIKCLVRNTAVECVERVHVIIQDLDSYNYFMEHVYGNAESPQPSAFFTPAQRAKLVPSLHMGAPRQPTYQDLFYYTTQLLAQQLVMVMNADIFIKNDFPVAKVHAAIDGGGAGARRALALTRHERDPDGHAEPDVAPFTPLRSWQEAAEGPVDPAPLITEYKGSHDAFIFRPPLPASLVASTNHPQNCYQAENAVIYEFYRHNYSLLNPCREARVYHQHNINIRQWLPSPAAHATPLDLAEADVVLPSTPSKVSPASCQGGESMLGNSVFDRISQRFDDLCEIKRIKEEVLRHKRQGQDQRAVQPESQPAAEVRPNGLSPIYAGVEAIWGEGEEGRYGRVPPGTWEDWY